MQQRILQVFVGICLSGVAVSCSSMDPAQEAVDTTQMASTTGTGCTGMRWVAEYRQRGCPDGAPGHWNVAPAFRYPGAATPPQLAHYCEYTWGGTSPPTALEIKALTNHVALWGAGKIEQDCVLVGPLTTEQSLRGALHDSLLDQSGAMQQGLPAGGAMPPASIRIAMVDSSPTAPPNKIPMGRLPHGYALSWLVRDLTCPRTALRGKACVGNVVTHLALPHLRNDVVDRVQGGYFGTRLQLAQAVYAAVEDWKASWAASPATADQRLVINLSLGWEPTDNCATAAPDEMELAAATVYRALQHASCHGALIIAAAGNKSGKVAGSSNEGMVCPAAWTLRPAPDLTACNALEGVGYLDGIPAGLPIAQNTTVKAPKPMVFAAGGVDYAGRPIASTRELSRPRYAAVSVLGTSASTGVDYPAPMTGTSVSAAILSGVAAAAWAYRPELTGPEVMNNVYWSGKGTMEPADVDITCKACEVRSARLCDAIAHTCGQVKNGMPERCPAVPVTCGASSWASTSTPPLAQNRQAFLSEFNDAPVYSYTPAPGLMPAPEDLYQSMQVAPFVVPQPPLPACGVCGVMLPKENLTLYVRISPQFNGVVNLAQTTLTVRGTTGVAIQTPWGAFFELKDVVYNNLGPQTYKAGESFSVSLGSYPLQNVHGAFISWAVLTPQNSTMALTEQVQVSN